MNVLLKKGTAYSAEYSSTDFPILSPDWVGNVSLYKEYPGIATLSKALTLSGNVMLLDLTVAEILNLDGGAYYLVTTLSNAVLNISIASMVYTTVTEIVVSSQPMTLLTMTIGKVDGTATGAPTQTMVNTVNGLVLTAGWKGVQVKATVTSAFNIGTEIIGTETVSTETNAAGYAQLPVIKGSVVTVTCPSFGKSVTVDTTGLDTIDLSTFF